MDELKSVITDIFSIKNETVLETFFAQSKLSSYNKHDVLIKPEDLTEQLFFLVSGCAREYVIDEEGRDNTFRFAYKAGDILINDNRSGSDSLFCWEALSNAVVLNIPYSVYLEACYADKELQIQTERYLQTAFQREALLRYSLLTKFAQDRYLWFKEYYSDFPSSIPQKYIATYLNMLPQTLSELKHELKLQDLL